MRKPGEPIYQRRHMLSLALAVGLPLVLLQLYKVYVGPISFGIQLLVGFVISVASGLALYLIYRSSAQNQP
jgi:L-cystine uptake protein TcyP (sodium:dicarboxylate symporter family)